jgi:hypothetical protein
MVKMQRMEVFINETPEPGVLFKIYSVKKGGKHELQTEFFLEDQMIKDAYMLTQEKKDV